MKLWKKVGIGILGVFFLLIIIGILIPSPETETNKITGKSAEAQLREGKEGTVIEFGKPQAIKLSNAGNSDIYGDKVVFDGASSGNGDIFLYDISSGKTIRITFDNSAQGNPQIYEDIIIWIDERFEPREIFAYSISNGKEEKLKIETKIIPGAINFYKPEPIDLYKDILVLRGYDENRRYALYVYNLTSKETIQLHLDPDPTDDVGVSISQIYDYKLVGTYGDDILIYDMPNNSTEIIERPLAQSSPFMYGNTIVWSDTRNGKINNDIYAYDFSTDEELHVTTQQDTVETKPLMYKNFVFYLKFRWVSTGGSSAYGDDEQLIMHDLYTGEEKVLQTPCTVMDKIYENKMLCRDLEDDDWITYILIFE